ncbi:TIGR04255 family protein [Falsigemmobacter faecalis]|uniref:TIGR04255 family protein n=1 Tax=Falsigemmobacter faecalis TaxID=2488730 RepID=A0A3P3DQZ6_9RHOB|nr:TIGR04255 family protein [Falsigemmobacter faecalis]RRH76581.1 TIGR04255 family protein [Falsigemmobacter faecalis]
MTVSKSDPLSGPIPDRVHLPSSPLVRVLAQVKFTRIAKISDERYISDFQEAIRADLPHFEADTVHNLDIQINGAEITPRQATTVVWRFFDPSRIHRLTLAPDALTLETTAYTTRQDFLGQFSAYLSCLADTIRPSLIDRLGVRYVDRISDPKDLSNLAALLRPELAGVLQPQLLNKVEVSMTEISAVTSEGKLVARYGLLPGNTSHDPEMLPPSSERSWVLDIDSSTLRLSGMPFDTAQLYAELDSLAGRAYSFFRWGVTEEFLNRFKGN